MTRKSQKGGNCASSIGCMKDGQCCNRHHGASTKSSQSEAKSIDRRFRDYIVRTNIDLILIACVLAWCNAGTAFAETTGDAGHEATSAAESSHATEMGEHGSIEHEQEEEAEEVHAVLFPWFIQLVGIFVYYLLSRFCHVIPFTAIMFIIGFFIGFFKKAGGSNALTDSTKIWLGINGEVILLVFLPGLLYLDSYNIDVHLFLQSFWQLINFAFPMVLGGTALTALVAYFIFPYGWSLDLSMTFGSILAATDPVAVAVLLNELGAPPRLKMHISGESLMNDGSAVVFYYIFSQRFYYELGLPGVGQDIGWAKGFELFFRLSLGGACIGTAFGIGVVYILYHLNRRLSGEDNLVQVVLTITAAYLVFYTSEIVAHCSGIIAVVCCGITVKAFGETLINDSHLTHNFWHITEHLLNTLLFALAGCVWGDVIAVDSYTEGLNGSFGGKDWGFLLLLYALVIAIRFFLIFAFFPITKRIGLGTNWKESLFAAWGGLRGAVGIALALSLHSEIVHYTSTAEIDEVTRIQYRQFSGKMFGFVGGIAFLTLLINATTCGPLLKKLGLVTPTETRKMIIQNYKQHMIQYTLVEYVKLMTEERFQNVDFTVMKAHIPYFKDITYEQLVAATKKYRENTPAKHYVEPNLKHIVPYLYTPVSTNEDGADSPTTLASSISRVGRTQLMKNRQQSVAQLRRKRKTTVFDLSNVIDHSEVHEERTIFIQILRSTYSSMIERGELESRGFIPYSLFKSLDYAQDAACKGLPLNDWEAMQAVSNSWAKPAEKALLTLFHWKQRIKGEGLTLDRDFLEVYTQVRQILAFTRAHEQARSIFKNEFSIIGKDSLSTDEKVVLDESKAQVSWADEILKGLETADVQMIKSHYTCQMLLNKSAGYFEKLAKRGLVTGKEAGEFLEEVEEDIFHVLQCRHSTHKDELTEGARETRLRTLPTYMLNDLLGFSGEGVNAKLPDIAEDEWKEDCEVAV